MNRNHLLLIACLVAVMPSVHSDVRADEKQPALQLPDPVRAVLKGHCVRCHGEQKPKGEVRLDDLEKLEPSTLRDLLGRLQEAVHFREMPPEGAKQLAPEAFEVLMAWSGKEVRRLGGADLTDKLRLPNYGNAVDHAKLFSGQIKDKPYTPARRWLVSPQIFRERVLDSLRVEGPARKQPLHGVASPFALPERSGVRDYDLTPLDGTHFVALRANAALLADKVIGSLRIKLGEPREKVFANPKDRWTPPSVGDGKRPLMDAFEQVMTKKTSPSEDELTAAIQLQFNRELARPASDAEATRYMKLMRSVEKIAGNTESLRKMLEAVWLESEFVYRLEFGAGEPDSFGRKQLSPREASYAIAYALGDKAPDAALVKAANEGRLNTRADYEREVKRLLADLVSHKGPVDSLLSREHLESYISTPHPKIVRFFREFFGYPLAVRVFKDTERSDGIYRVPDRGTSGTPGFLIVEADRVVARIVETDRSVFESLLTTDQYFVYHNMDSEKGAKLIAGWRIVYDTLKDTNWRKDPDGVAKEHAALLKQYVSPTGIKGKRGKGVHETDLLRLMKLFEETFGRGGRPFTTFPWAHGNRFWHSPLYNMAPTPAEGNYGKEGVFDYEPVQPFKVPNRKGILTHPAWLIAHAQNSATDPIRRGKWIREKLLAGMVPDVPITVDAQIPEHKDKTLRERLDLATNKQVCWKCHQHMNPLGLAFEMYDDFGRFRTAENLEHPDNVIAKAKFKNGADTYKTASVVSTGRLDGTGDSNLDGDVKDAIDLIDRLAKSERVRQSIIRHAFRFYLGRNEMLNDSQTLIDADRAYVNSGGSFKAVIVSMLTSDSFMYRK